MQVQDVMANIRDSLSVKRVFGDAYEKNGTTVIPVARILGGGGGGGGAMPRDVAGADGAVEGSGGGFGVIARPAGVFVIKDGDALWRPAVDVTRVIIGAQFVAVAGLLTVRSILKARAKRA